MFLWLHFATHIDFFKFFCYCADGSCLVHSTGGELLHKLVSAYNWTFPHLITLTSRGHIVVHYADQKGCIVVFSCNGKQFAQCALGDPALVKFDEKHSEFF